MSDKADLHEDPADIDAVQRIYVNRNLRLSSIRAIGFDMDHTLAIYKPVPFERLAFAKARAKLIMRGYPRSVQRLRYQPDFVVRGLTVDKRRGNILKMDRHRYVVQAYHGTRKLPSEMRKTLYSRRRILLGGKTFALVDTLFSLPEISLYAQMVDLLDRREPRPDYRRLYEEVRESMDEAHADGSIKSVIAADPLRYLQIDPHLPDALNRMRSHGIKLFLLTNSEADYTALIMHRLLSGRFAEARHWTEFFDHIIVRAGKPGFFGRAGPLRRMAPQGLGAPRRRGGFQAYKGGSVRALQQALELKGDDILYFGDHTYGDILKSKRTCGWRTAMIIQGLENELRHLHTTGERRRERVIIDRRLDRLIAGRDFLERALEGQLPVQLIRRFLRERGMRGGLRRVPAHLTQLHMQIRQLMRTQAELGHEIDQAFNPFWGALFRAGREKSHFAEQVREFACIYTSRVSNFLHYPLDKFFVTTHEFMPHELGRAGS